MPSVKNSSMETEFEVRYVPDAEFKAYVDSHKWELIGYEGKTRWLITEDDGTKYIIRPDSSKV